MGSNSWGIELWVSESISLSVVQRSQCLWPVLKCKIDSPIRHHCTQQQIQFNVAGDCSMETNKLLLGNVRIENAVCG